MKKHIRIGIIMVLVLCTNITIFAQREQTRKVTATGSYVASTNETPAYGQAQALLEAKKQALREAGVMENISSTAIIVMGSTGTEFQDLRPDIHRCASMHGDARLQLRRPKCHPASIKEFFNCHMLIKSHTNPLALSNFSAGINMLRIFPLASIC